MRQKRSLGQIFLKDQKYIKKILGQLTIKDENVLEIGPGKGQISIHLANKAKKLYCIEVDKRFCSFLSKVFFDNPRVKIIHSDILKFPFSRLEEPLVIFSNAPYQISSSLIKYLIKQRRYIKSAFLTFQTEFADKLLAEPLSGQYGFISCYVQYYGRVEGLFTIPKSAFKPVPKVDSTFLKIDFYNKPLIEVKDEDFLFKVIQKAFSAPRKKVVNALGLDKLKQKIVSSLKIDTNLRPQDLSLKDYATIANELYPRIFF